MRIKHELENKFDAWKKAGYGDTKIHDLQETEVKRAFMGGVFEGLNFLIDQLENSPELMNENIQNTYKFLKAFHDNEVNIHNKSPFGKKYF